MAEFKQSGVAEWVNLHSNGTDNFTALHYASFFGNILMSELLIKHGANVFAVNHLGINMVHVAAQGDQPISISFYENRGISINSKDNKDSSALHWAAYVGADQAIGFLIAWGADLNLIDKNG
jgi:palmitoyltransferase ZDHHC13/17